MFENTSVVFAIVGLTLTVIASVWSLAWWLSGKFGEINKLIYDQGEKIARFFNDRLESHQKHDDLRFGEVNDAIWEIKVRNASVDGVKINKEK